LPHGGQRGTQLEVVISGTSLDDAQEILLDGPGLEFADLRVPAAPAQDVASPERGRRGGRRGRNNAGPTQELRATLKIASDCAMGSHRIRVRTATGLSNLVNFYVGPLPIVEEKEPNTDFTRPQAVPLNVTVHGRIDREDSDYFVVECKQGERLTVEVYGMRLGTSSGNEYFDPYVAILDENRFELVTSDDTPIAFSDAVASMIVPADGEYRIAIRDAAYNGDGQAYYLLHIGSFPRPMAVYPAGGRPGETLAVNFLNDIAGEVPQQLTLPTDPPERYGLEVSGDGGTAPSNLPFRVLDLPSVLEQEPNNERTAATPAGTPGAMNGIIEKPGDIDFFKFTAKKGQRWHVEVFARRLRSPLDPLVTIRRAGNGQQLSADDDGRGADSYLRFEAPDDGDYVVQVRDHLFRGGPAHVYRIEVTPIEPRIDASPIEFRRYEQPQVVIPRGGAVGLVINVERREFDGPVAFKCPDLPAGVSIECPEEWQPGGQIPLVFRAAEDAPLSGKYADIIAHLADPRRPDMVVQGPLVQNILMIRGPNDTRVWQERETRLPIVVTERAPFRVWIEPPKVPIVRGGSQQLVVRCERDEGFAGPISVQLLRNPPGCNSNGSIRIDADKNEAAIPINAANDAELKESSIAVRATAQVGRGQVEVCTPLVPLRVEERFITLQLVPAVIEQGTQTSLVAKVKKQRDFDGEAQVTLLNLPANATAEPLKMTKETAELVFTVIAADNTPRGNNKNLLCQVLVPVGGQTVLHSLGTGRLRVDPPTQPAASAAAAAQPAPAAPNAPAKVLSRLELLRQQQRERLAVEKLDGEKQD
jgi:hypothetical protein